MAQPQYGEDRFSGVGGLSIFFRWWCPETPPRAVVAIVHGFNAHSGHYTWVAEQLIAKGFAAYALDLRGRGRSDGERFFVERFADYVSDVETLVRLVKLRQPGLPVFLLGHSAGGVVACIYTLDHQPEIDGLICESFAFEVPAPDFALAVFKGLSHVAPHAQILRLRNEDFSRDPKWVQTLNQDPLIAHEIQPTQTLAEMVRADERLRNEFPKITLPLMVIHGTEDKATRPNGSRRFFDRAGAIDKTLKLYDGYFHDPLHDLGKDFVMADVVTWVSARIPAARPATLA